MTGYFIVELMGRGKTLFATAYSFKFRDFTIEKYDVEPNIFATYPIDIPNFTLLKFGFIPYNLIESLENCLIIIDDCSMYSDLNELFSLLVNRSRKRNIDIIFTGQYYTHIERKGRMTLTYEVGVNYDSDTKTMLLNYKDLENNDYPDVWYNLDNFYDKYDTHYVCESLTKSQRYQYVIENCTNLVEVEKNLFVMFNKTEANKFLKKAVKERKFLLL